jgi:hypothetical protein
MSSEKWTQEALLYDDIERVMDWKDCEDGRIKYTRSGRYAGERNDCTNGAAEIRIKKHYNGSGLQAFGGANEWPHVTLGVSFPAGEEAMAMLLVLQLQVLVDGFMTKHGLDVPADGLTAQDATRGSR